MIYIDVVNLFRVVFKIVRLVFGRVLELFRMLVLFYLFFDIILTCNKEELGNVNLSFM